MALNDKFYTKVEIAQKCIERLEKFVDLKQEICLEPSAGNGAFLSYLPKYEAYDILPESDKINQLDFFDFSSLKTDYVVVGNPPFGKRSKTAIDFFNHAAKYAKIIAFIVPVSFMKWSVQKELDKRFHLVDFFYLEPNSFLDRDKEFSVRTVFQIWMLDSSYGDLRLQKMPSTKHEDFDIWQYNATIQSLSVVEEDWKIAVYRQGYHDYNKRFYPEQRDYIRRCMTGQETGGKQQFFFIKPKTKEAEQIIEAMDFNALAERNTSIPGFGKGDFVSYYIEKKRENR